MRPPAPAPESDQVAPGPVAVPETSSENVTVISSDSCETAEAICGAMPSETATEAACTALDDGSDTAPEPEPGSPSTSLDVVLYRSDASGLVPSRFPESVSTTELPSDAAVLASTVRPAASVPDTDQP